RGASPTAGRGARSRPVGGIPRRSRLLVLAAAGEVERQRAVEGDRDRGGSPEEPVPDREGAPGESRPAPHPTVARVDALEDQRGEFSGTKVEGMERLQGTGKDMELRWWCGHGHQQPCAEREYRAVRDAEHPHGEPAGV